MLEKDRGLAMSQYIITTLALLLGIAASAIASGDDHNSNYTYSEPPKLNGCSPLLPGNSKERDCVSFEKTLNLFFEQEGSSNRGKLFLAAIQLFELENRNGDRNLNVKVGEFIKHFGKPDYRRETTFRGENVTEYAYLFNNHSHHDWICVISFTKDRISTIWYNETKVMLLAGWDELE